MYCKITVIPSSSFLNNWGVIDVQYCIMYMYSILRDINRRKCQYIDYCYI